MRIEIPVFDGFDELDTVGPYEVLRNANQMGADAGWDVALVGAHGPGEVVAAHGLRLSLTDSLGHPDAVLAPGGGWTGRTPCGTWHEVKAGVLPARLAELALSCRWVASVCTWAILLAAAGLNPHRQRRADLDRQRPSPAASSPRPLDKPPPVPHGRMRTPTTQRSDATPPVDTSRSKSLLPNRRPTSSGSHALNTALSRCCQTLLATVTTATGRSTACHRDTTAGGSSAVAAAQSARVVVSRWYPNGSCRRADWTTGPTGIHHACGGVELRWSELPSFGTARFDSASSLPTPCCWRGPGLAAGRRWGTTQRDRRRRVAAAGRGLPPASRRSPSPAIRVRVGRRRRTVAVQS